MRNRNHRREERARRALAEKMLIALLPTAAAGNACGTQFAVLVLALLAVVLWQQRL